MSVIDMYIQFSYCYIIITITCSCYNVILRSHCILPEYLLSHKLLAAIIYSYYHQSQLLQLVSYLFSQSDVDLDYLIMSTGYLTSVGPCGWHDALSPVQTYELAASVAIEALSSSINRDLYSTGIIELPKSVWYHSTTLLLVSPTVECTSTLSNVSQREGTVITVNLSIDFKVDT